MRKWYEVQVQCWKVVVVEVEDDEEVTPNELENDATEVAFSECFPFETEKEIGKVTLLETQEDIDRAKRHADEVFDLEN